MFGVKVFGDFQGAFFKKPLEARSPNAVPTVNEKNKKRGFLRVFSCALSVGASAPNPDQRNFLKKVSLKSSKTLIK